MFEVIVTQPWFLPAIAVVVLFPILLVVCTEAIRALSARGSRAVGLVKLVRNFALPLGALLILLFQMDNLSLEVNASRIVATVLGFVLILIVINMLNFAIFATAERGSWRDRLPSIFIDIAKLVVIVICFALLFQWVWGADIGGLFTALGVTTIVIGLALQNAAGSVVSGLLLLFEQPFRLGDWLDADGVRGRVVEVNWRAVHIDTGNGTRIIPTSSLAGSSFTNLSRVTDFYDAQTTVKFSNVDSPSDVVLAIRDAADELPLRVPDLPAQITPKGNGEYAVSIPVVGPSDEGPTIAVLIGWLWFAARRAGLHLDGEGGDGIDIEPVRQAAIRTLSQRLALSDAAVEMLQERSRVERYGAGEHITRAGQTVDALRYVLDGTVTLTGNVVGRNLAYHTLIVAEPIGLGVYTRQPENDTAVAVTTVTTISIPRDAVEHIVTGAPRLAVELGRLSDNRAQLLDAAIESSAQGAGVK